MSGHRYRTSFEVADYDLAATLGSGQAFRWDEIRESGPREEAAVHGAKRSDSTKLGVGIGSMRRGRSVDAWDGVVAARWVRVRSVDSGRRLEAETVVDPGDWAWLRGYLGVDEALGPVLASFPSDAPMTAAVEACRGLRLLRQEPWECLASFLLSSTKQIPQIREGVRQICARFGEVVEGPEGEGRVHAFPAPRVLARAGERELRECRIGFRARYLKETAERVASGEPNLDEMGRLTLAEARARLVTLPGVGPKIADCVLLFGFGFRRAFPVDVWVMRALRELYFRGRRPSLDRLREFSATHFGSNAGYAQQYLFHHIRMRAGRVPWQGAGTNEEGEGDDGH